MGIVESRCTLLDTAHFIHLLNKRKIDILDSHNFVEQFGFPFITEYNLVELAGTNDSSLWRQRIDSLASVSNWRSLCIQNSSEPGQLMDLFAWEIEALTAQKLSRFADVCEYIRSKIHWTDLRPWSKNALEKHQYAQDQRKKSSFLSVLNHRMLNPYFSKPVGPILNNPMNFEDKSKVNPFLENFFGMITHRGVKESKSRDLTMLFGSEIIKQANQYHGNLTVQDFLQMMTCKPIDPEKPFSYYLKRFEFENALIKIADSLGLERKIIRSLDISQTFSMRLKFMLKDQLDTNYVKDKRRKIELSNIADVHLACYSPYINVAVDARTQNLLKMIEKKIEIKLNFRHVPIDII